MRQPRCLCSRCSLFLKASNAEDLDDLEGVLKSQYFEQREYQTALINLAAKKNIIACLPTGSGKTYIAYKLVEHFQHDIASKGKKVFFLANTIPLVNQQAAFFARNLTMKVKHITGDMEVDYWTKDKWDTIVSECDIMAMTAQIFLNIVRHAYVKLSQIALIIFDECHHAQNEHPMKMIMTEYHATKKYPGYELPRILGLTATIIMGNCKVDEVPARIRTLESTMDSYAVTYKDYEAVLRHSTSASVQPLSISAARLDNWNRHSYYISELLEYAKQLQVLRKDRKKKANVPSVQGIDPTLRTISNIFVCNKKPSPGDLRIAVDDIRRTYLDMGEYCAVMAINLRLAFIEFSLMDLTDPEIKEWYKKIQTFFIHFRERLIEKMEGYSEEERVTQFITPKLRKLIDVIEENFGFSENDSNRCEYEEAENALCGLVFTDRRATAQVLAWYLKDLASKNPKYAFIKANFVVGTSRCPFETVESRIYAKKQTATINGFRSRKYNVLTATSVLEEGIDVPSCNLVVRFDPIQTYTSYVQSMGRARKVNALFYALLESASYCEGVTKLNNFKAINEAMVAHLRYQVQKIDEGWDQTFNPHVEHDIEPFCPGGDADSARISMESAPEVIQNHCMLLPVDGVASLQTLAWWTEHNDPGRNVVYQGHLKLPMNSIIKGTVEGIRMKSKELAKQFVFLEAAKRLHSLSGLDEKLCPIRPVIPVKVEAFITTLAPFTATGDEKEVNTGTTEEAGRNQTDTIASQLLLLRRREWYQKRIPEIFQQSRLVVGKRYIVYRISLELTKPNTKYKWQNLYNLQSKSTAFGIISAEDIPEVGSFPVFGGFGYMSVNLVKIPDFSINLNQDNYTTLRNFQRIVFWDLLHLRHELLQEENELSFAIIPLEKGKDGWRVFHELFPKQDHPGINNIFTIERTKPPNEDNRKYAARGQRFNNSGSNSDRYIQKYRDAVVYPWYKGRSKPVYVVDSVEVEMSPESKFHDGNFPSYKNFYKTEYKKEIYDTKQPLLKCKLAGVGAGKKQLNYLLEKYAKEDEFPVYLVPELCFIVPVPASILVQLKFIPSILHRLSRLLIAKEITTSIGEKCEWPGLWKVPNSTNLESDNIERLITSQQNDKTKEEERRKAREDARRRLKRPHKPIPHKKHIKDRELHYEFIHPNKISRNDIVLFHEAVSAQHSAKKLILPNNVEAELDKDELYIPSKIELMDFDDFDLPRLDAPLDVNTNEGPSLLCLVEAITRMNSNEGISFQRLKQIGSSFLSYAISTQIFHQFPDWTEPLMCQLRNRMMSVQVLSTIARRNNIGEILSGSGFYPNDTWLPPGFKLLPDVGEIAAENCVHLGVYDGLKNIRNMKKEDLEKHVREKATRLLEERMRPNFSSTTSTAAGRTKTPFNKFDTTYSHSEIVNWALADGLCALAGAFFTECGAKGATKLLEWFGFTLPDSDGTEHLIGSWNMPNRISHISVTIEEAEIVIQNLRNVETQICYRFKDRKLLLESLTHPSCFTNNISDCYQRLEFLGDGILDSLLTNYVFTKSTKHDIGKLLEIRAALVNSVTYASLAVRYEFHKYLQSTSKPLLDMIDNFVVFQEAAEHRVLGHFTLISDEECWGPKHIEVPKALGDVFEALAGAVYLDSGFSLDAVWKVFYRLMQNEIDDFFEDVPKSPIRELIQEFPASDLGVLQIQFENWTSAKLRARGREMVKISVAHLGHYYGTGTTKTRAKEAAAKIALKMCKDDDSIIEKFDKATIMMMI